MSAVRRFLLRSTLLRPSVWMPLVGGAVAGLASWVVGGSLILTTLAVAGIGGGLVWMIARTALNAETLTEQAMEAQRQSLRDDENRQLDNLARQLRTDRDHRTQDTLKLLRELRDDFEIVAKRPGAELLSARIAEQISQIFQSAVNQLRESFRLMERAESVVGDARDQILNERDNLVREVQGTADRLQSVIRQYQQMRPDSQESHLKTIQDELNTNLEIARRTEQRMQELENPLKSHESFLKE